MIQSGKGGGSFKTTATWGLSTWLSKVAKNCKVLVIENEGNSTMSGCMGADFNNSPTLYHIYSGAASLEEAIQETSMGHIISGNSTVEKIPAFFSNDVLEGAKALKYLMPEIEKMGFTHVIIDNAASVGSMLNLQSMLASDDIVVPYHPDPGHLQAFTNFIKSFAEAKSFNPKLRIDGILIGNLRRPITHNHRKYVGEIAKWSEHLKVRIYDTIIRSAIAVQTAQGNMETLWDKFPKENVTTDFERFILEYMATEGKNNDQ